jgi:hypothetical protein
VSYAYTDTKVTADVIAIDPFNLLQPAQNLRGKPLPLTPKNKYTLFADYDLDLGGNGDIKFGASYTHSGKFNNDPFGTFTGGDYGIINANIRYAPAGGIWWVNFFGRNLGNTVYTSATIFTDSLGRTDFYAAPLTLGAQVGFKF